MVQGGAQAGRAKVMQDKNQKDQKEQFERTYEQNNRLSDSASHKNIDVDADRNLSSVDNNPKSENNDAT